MLSLTENPGHTLLDALRMLNDKEFRASVVDGLEDHALLEFWENEFPSYSKGHKAEAFAPLQNKLGEFSINPRVSWVATRRPSRLMGRRGWHSTRGGMAGRSSMFLRNT